MILRLTPNSFSILSLTNLLFIYETLFIFIKQYDIILYIMGSNINLCTKILSNYKSLYVIVIALFAVQACHSENQPKKYFSKHIFTAGFQPGNLSVRSMTKYNNVRVFFRGAIITNKGCTLSYEKLVYSPNNFFTINVGGGIATWGRDHERLYLLRVYPNLRLWLYNKKYFGFYLNVCAGAPTILSKQYLYKRHLGSHFTFNDFIGIGARFGEKQAIEVSLTFHHYSNASIFRPNPGFDVPAVISISYAI